ncbi:hypothetical protein B5V88_16950 [Heyndrickxia sporothermodurans]|uniref:Transposase n=1 Tax=Heyndrickxia sporothermodurans TaxID=46224 RepID=A0AB37HEY4_9BACI|nr:hypothetical protein [Heyndrickxia sporothermodurans]MBL5769323.1 hypothetical protein [Heyndrickxia sporothermodurans]MBL5773105.1 hypothetical protein [Heyndrickxia sporothermodurans]MBL5776588.1 hypothetical protein [Heyndrickxia sporothermodurans]MBL5780096.1 hypothetical protein [Heyndrickxia sporothermodurans]MBL5783697.1 hypothetical protein [Heyndrickxia sporothermodurans]
MPEQKLTIVPVTLHSKNKDYYSSTSSTASSNKACTIKTANIEISFNNGVDEHIIQTVMRELRHL